MRRATSAALALAACAALTPVATSLGGDAGYRQIARYTLSQERPARSTSEHFVFDYVNPDDPAAKPPAVRKVVTVLPRGARYDTGAPVACRASDAELMLEGGAACPAGSRIGGGVVTVDTGIPGPGRFVTADVEFFNNADEFIYLNTIRDGGGRTVIRADVTKRRTITVVDPPLPGTPPDGGAIDTADLTVDSVSRVRDGVRRNYVTTPPDCPPREYWVTKVRFVYGDGVSQTVKNRVGCER